MKIQIINRKNKLKKITVLFFIFLLFGKCYAKHLYKEKDYQAQWCNKQGGQMEFVLDEKTRVDCLLPDEAVEFDFALKWAECIGQALYYGKMTSRIPACVLIIENTNRDLKYLNRLKYTVENTNFKIYFITNKYFEK